MLSDTEREQLTALLRVRDALLTSLDSLWAKDEERKAHGDTHWSDETEEKALEVVAANAKLLKWNDSHLVGKYVADDEDGFPAAKYVTIAGGWIDIDDRDELPRWHYEEEEFLTASEDSYREYGSPATLLTEERSSEEPGYSEYMRALRYAAKHGWPPLTKKHRKNLQKLIEHLREASHYVEDLLAHG
jgi:hypothetical protein